MTVELIANDDRATINHWADGPIPEEFALRGFHSITAWVSMGIVAKDRWPIRWLEINGNFQRVSAEQLRAGLIPLISSSFFKD